MGTFRGTFRGQSLLQCRAETVKIDPRVGTLVDVPAGSLVGTLVGPLVGSNLRSSHALYSI